MARRWALIGGAASVARYLVHGLFPVDVRAGFPLGTLAVNLSGSFVLGLLVGAGLDGDAYLLAGTAAVGSYTTFSTWMLDTERLARDGRGWRVACGNAAREPRARRSPRPSSAERHRRRLSATRAAPPLSPRGPAPTRPQREHVEPGEQVEHDGEVHEQRADLQRRRALR